MLPRHRRDICMAALQPCPLAGRRARGEPPDPLPPPQPPAAAAAAERILAAADDWTLAALDSVTGSCKSFVLALALCRRRLSAREVCVAARVAEQYQTDLWGEVEAGHDLDRADLQVRVSAASAFLRMLP